MQRHQPPRELSRGPFTTAQGLAHVSPGALAGPGYRRLLRGVYQAADLPVTYGTRIGAVFADATSDLVLAGPSAAWALGVSMSRPDDPVHLAVANSWPGERAAVRRHQMTLGSADVVATRYGPATSPVRTALDLARGLGTAGLPHHRRVAWVDALLRATGLPAADLRGRSDAAAGARGAVDARRVLRDARDGVDSPKETELRLLVIRLGFPEPTVQCPVRDSRGKIFASLDLGWEEWLAGAEYDGAVHREADQHSRDLARHNKIREFGWNVLRVDARALFRPAPFIQQLEAWVPRRA